MKKIFTSSFATVVCIAFVMGQAFAGPPVYFKSPIKFRGTGCPQGTYTVSGENTDTITIMFGQYDAAKPPRNAASGMFRTSCNFVVPVSVPSGYQLANITANWRGYAEGKTKLHREYFFANQRGPSINSRPTGDYTLQDNLMHNIWWSCNRGDVPMRINSSIRAQGNPSYIVMDQMDIKQQDGGVTFRLKWRKCR
ncbi:DUF4360 domain-containing protein [Candidatus Electrothrix gigas]